MLILDTRPRPAPAARFLKSDLALAYRQGQPVTTRPWRYYLRAEALMSRHFPEQLAEALEEDPGDYYFPDWCKVQSYFLGCVERAGWFAIDWALLDYLGEWAMNDYPEGDEDPETWIPDGLRYLGEYLDGIPVMFFGFSGEDWNNDIGHYPALALLAALVGAEAYAMMQIDQKMDIFDDLRLSVEGQEATGERIGQTDWTQYDEPLCWLGQMADYVSAATGNPLLDEALETWDLWPMRWLWDRDLDTVKDLYAQAQPVLERAKKFCNAFDTEEALRELYEAINGLS